MAYRHDPKIILEGIMTVNDEVMSMLRRVRSLEAKVLEAHALLKEAWAERDALKVENAKLKRQLTRKAG